LIATVVYGFQSRPRIAPVRQRMNPMIIPANVNDIEINAASLSTGKMTLETTLQRQKKKSRGRRG